MRKLDIIQELIEKKGIVRTSDVNNIGIDNVYIPRAIKANIIVKYCSTVYISPTLEFDPFYVNNKIIDSSVYNLTSALIIHNFNDEIPHKYTLACHKSNNKIHNVDCFIEKNLELGKIKCKTSEGNYIYTFDLERTICDLIKYKAKLDASVYSKAIFKYFTSHDRDLDKIASYAKKLDIYDKVLPIMEVFYEAIWPR